MVKGPKILNPADRARREERKKELKKNKKQRQQVRSAAIEKKDPEQIISDLEKLDRLEFDLTTNAEFSDAVHKEKRKRLKESFSKILGYYLKEDPERHANLKKLESDYDVKHKRLAREFEAIKAAQEVKIEDIFLPPEQDSALDEIADDDPLLSESVFITHLTEGVKPPGCPPGPPPDFKQIVDNLKSSFEAQMVLDSMPLPASLLNLDIPGAISGHTEHKNFSERFRGRAAHSIKYNAHQKRNLDIQPSQKSRQLSNTGSEAPKQQTSPTKAAVIESKPVLFMPKATKFVPSSVRSKVIRSNAKD